MRILPPSVKRTAYGVGSAAGLGYAGATFQLTGCAMPFVQLLITVIDLYTWVIIIGVILSWLLTFGVINGSNQVVRAVYNFCAALTEPPLRVIRRHIKPFNGVDLSPIVLILLLWLTQYCLAYYVMRPLMLRGL